MNVSIYHRTLSHNTTWILLLWVSFQLYNITTTVILWNQSAYLPIFKSLIASFSIKLVSQISFCNGLKSREHIHFSLWPDISLWVWPFFPDRAPGSLLLVTQQVIFEKDGSLWLEQLSLSSCLLTGNSPTPQLKW